MKVIRGRRWKGGKGGKGGWAWKVSSYSRWSINVLHVHWESSMNSIIVKFIMTELPQNVQSKNAEFLGRFHRAYAAICDLFRLDSATRIISVLSKKLSCQRRRNGENPCDVLLGMEELNRRVRLMSTYVGRYGIGGTVDYVPCECIS